MKKTAIESRLNSRNKRWKWISKIKEAIAPIVLTILMTWCHSPNSTNPDTKTITIWKWATLTTIVKDSLWLSDDITSDPKLCKILVENVAQQNNIDDANKIQLNDTLTVNMENINREIENYQANTLWIPNKWDKKEQREVTKDGSYTTIHSMEEFKKSDNYLIKKIYKDKNINWKFLEALKNGYSVRFLNPIETNDSPSLSVDEITKPNEIVWSELKGKTFILDPGHGSLDTWAIGLAQFWDKENKEKVAVYESAIMMDLTYRIARELRAHGANVDLTHHMNRRWIRDIKDLPPCSRVFNNNWGEIFQDIWDWTEKESKWNLFNADWKYLKKRAEIANKHTPNLFVSLHADILRKGKKVDEESKILSIKYDERQSNKEGESIAKELLNNGFWYYYNWKLAEDVKRDVAQQHLWVLKPSKSPAILIEFWNISQESQAYILREYTKREELAKNFVSSLIKVYKK